MTPPASDIAIVLRAIDSTIFQLTQAGDNDKLIIALNILAKQIEFFVIERDQILAICVDPA